MNMNTETNNPSFLTHLKQIHSFVGDKKSDFSKKEQQGYLQALQALAINLQEKLHTISKETGSIVSLSLTSSDLSYCGDGECFGWIDPTFHIDDLIFHLSSSSFNSYSSEFLVPLNESIVEIINEFYTLGNLCNLEIYRTVDHVSMIISVENIEIEAISQLRQTCTNKIKI